MSALKLRKQRRRIPRSSTPSIERDYGSDPSPSTSSSFSFFEPPPRTIPSTRPHPRPPRSLESLRTESLGFFIYLASLSLFYLYLFWAFAPDSFLRSLGIEYYPSREWALLIPSWTVVFFGMVYVWYLGINIMHTPAIDDICTVTDCHAVIPSFDELVEDVKLLQRGGIPPTHDLPLGLINQVMFED
ncbi:PIG-P-domain-containing protein [Atractiella rhizophila]|nr:PIG-P-domain-containing protein [Atractiella rhizophila]